MELVYHFCYINFVRYSDCTLQVCIGHMGGNNIKISPNYIPAPNCYIPNCYILRFFVKSAVKITTKNSTKSENTP